MWTPQRPSLLIYNANGRNTDLFFSNLVDLYYSTDHISFYFPVTNAVVCLPGVAEQH